MPSTRASARLAPAALVLAAAVLVLAAACRTAAPLDVERVARAEASVGRLLLVGFEGTAVDNNVTLERLLCDAKVGGILLFARNIVDPAQLAALTRGAVASAAACGNGDLLVAVDAEGGNVMRLSPAAGYAATLTAQELGDANDLTVTELEARRIGAMLREAGITWDLAPVVDVGYNPANPVVVGPGRSFSADPQRVTAQARAFIGGLRTEGVRTTLKHFPGHGSSWHDSHRGFVDVTETANLEIDLVPYRLLFPEHIVDSVMTAHVLNRKLDGRYPATLSRATVDGLLRRTLGWDGLVVSDDLRMGAIEQHWGIERAVVLAVDAGVDVLLIADDRLPDGDSAAAKAADALRRALRRGRLSVERVESALGRVETFAGRRAP